jgi:hypothetical protein
MTDQDQPIVPAPGSHRPRAVNVRLVCPPGVPSSCKASLADFYGQAWQPSARKPSRSSDGDLLQYGTLIVPVPVPGSPCPSLYPECPAGDRRCVRTDSHPDPTDVHYKRAGFGWTAQEAAESAACVKEGKVPDR